MGTNVDELLAYETPKVVRIKDRMLGMLKYTFMLVIFCYVFVYTLAYKGSHFQLDQLSGVARLQLQHPTMRCNPMDKACRANYSSLEQLPYCKQYTGKNASAVVHKCQFSDALDLLIPVDAGNLIPSFIETYDQLPSCKPNAKNKFKCDNKYEFVDEDGNAQTGPGRAKPKSQYFVADIEDFTLLIDHSFRVETGSLEYDDYQMQGYWLDCSSKSEKTETQILLNTTQLAKLMGTVAPDCEKKPIMCMHKDCKNLGMIMSPRRRMRKTEGKRHKRLTNWGSQTGRSLLQQSMSTVGSLHGSARLEVDTSEALELEDELEQTGISDMHGRRPSPDVYSLPGGDVLSMRTLYAMAGLNLDDWRYDESSKANKTTRQRGSVLVVNIHYNNLKPWTLFRPLDPPEYTISVTRRPVEKYKAMRAIEGKGKTREIKVAYGTLVIVQSSGTIGVFRMIHMLIVVSTSLGLMAVASVLTDLLAMYLLPMREEYGKAKYQETADFHEMFEKREAEGAM